VAPHSEWQWHFDNYQCWIGDHFLTSFQPTCLHFYFTFLRHARPSARSQSPTAPSTTAPGTTAGPAEANPQYLPRAARLVPEPERCDAAKGRSTTSN